LVTSGFASGSGRQPLGKPGCLDHHVPPFNQKEEKTMDRTVPAHREQPWNKGKLVGQQAPLRIKDIGAIRVRLQMQGRRCRVQFAVVTSEAKAVHDFAAVSSKRDRSPGRAYRRLSTELVFSRLQ
jgi:hypothetical protein